MTERRLYAGEAMRGDYNPFVGGGEPASCDSCPDEEPAMHWTDGFPHDFHGWGPLAPDYGHDEDAGKEIKRGEGEQKRFRTRLRFDDDYLTWRARQLEQREADFSTCSDEGRTRVKNSEH